MSPFWIAIKLILHVCYDYVTGSGETFVHSHHSVSNLKYIRFGNSIYFRDRLRFYCYLKCNKKFELSWLYSTFAWSSSLRALFFFSLNVFDSSWITQVFISLFHINVYSHLKLFFVSLVKKHRETIIIYFLPNKRNEERENMVTIFCDHPSKCCDAYIIHIFKLCARFTLTDYHLHKMNDVCFDSCSVYDSSHFRFFTSFSFFWNSTRFRNCFLNGNHWKLISILKT